MFLNNQNMAKMSESTIAEQYSRYLQRVSIIDIASRMDGLNVIDQENFLSYGEFKDYYLLELVGRGDRDYLNKLVEKLQHEKYAQGA
jgi:hypothetical protein